MTKHITNRVIDYIAQEQMSRLTTEVERLTLEVERLTAEENPVLNLARHFFGPGVYEVPVKDRLVYTRDDLVRAITAQQWAVAIALHAGRYEIVWHQGDLLVAYLPCAVDVVEGMEQS